MKTILNKTQIGYIYFYFFIFILALLFRLYHIEFGLPHSWYADEPEFGELAIKYTFEFKDIIQNNNYYKLIPISFVYGTVPTYALTFATMSFSKINNIIGNTFDKTDIYIWLRSINALLSSLIIPLGALLYYKLFKNKLGAALTFFLLALNWKLIVHAHYLNADIILTLILTTAFLTTYMYYQRPKTKYVVFTGILLGLAIGTKITAALTFPLFFYIFLYKKDYKSLVALFFLILGAFMISNPFSIIFLDKYIFRIYTLLTKENGIVFDSIDLSLFKYIKAAGWIVTPLAFLISTYAIAHTFIKKRLNPMHVLLIGNILFYILFYSISKRRVDRWLLPILPILLIYASHGFILIKQKLTAVYVDIFFICTLIVYLAFPILLIYQFQRHTPKSNAYIWMRDNLDPFTTTYAITEEGLDPLNKLPLSTVKQHEVYESSGAQFFTPPSDISIYDYIVLSSRPMENFKKEELKKRYPRYSQVWQEFENTVLDPTKFKLIKEYVLPKPNLIPLSDVYVYMRI